MKGAGPWPNAPGGKAITPENTHKGGSACARLPRQLSLDIGLAVGGQALEAARFLALVASRFDAMRAACARCSGVADRMSLCSAGDGPLKGGLEGLVVDIFALYFRFPGTVVADGFGVNATGAGPGNRLLGQGLGFGGWNSVARRLEGIGRSAGRPERLKCT